jgi:hypothetical protein
MRRLLWFFPRYTSFGRKFYYSPFYSLSGDVVVPSALMVRTVTASYSYFISYYLRLKYRSSTTRSPIDLDATSYPRITECSASWYCYTNCTPLYLSLISNKKATNRKHLLKYNNILARNVLSCSVRLHKLAKLRFSWFIIYFY